MCAELARHPEGIVNAPSTLLKPAEAVKPSTPIFIGTSKDKPVSLIGGGCGTDPDTGKWKVCNDKECNLKSPFGGNFLELLTERAVAKQELQEILHHALDEKSEPQQ